MGSMSVVGVEKEITESVYNNLHLVDGTCIEFINSQKLKRNNTSGACGIYKLKIINIELVLVLKVDVLI